MSIGRDLLACASVGDFTIFAGGSAPQVNQSETDEVDIWNHRTGAWTQGKLSQKRKKPEAVTAGGMFLTAVGWRMGMSPRAQVYLGRMVVDLLKNIVDL